MILFLQNIVSFILLVLVQVLVLNNIQFLGFVNPYIYILFIFSLPVRMPKWSVLIIAFFLGIIIDAFSNSLGMHAFASVLIAFLRQPVIHLFISIEEGSNPTPSFKSFGIAPYVKYISLLVLIHHTTLFLLEAFSFTHFWIVFLKILLSSFVTVLVILGVRSFHKK